MYLKSFVKDLGLECILQAVYSLQCPFSQGESCRSEENLLLVLCDGVLFSFRNWQKTCDLWSMFCVVEVC